MCRLNKRSLAVRIFIVFLFFNQSSKAIEFENWTFLGASTKIRNMNFSFHSANFFRNGNEYYLNHTQLSLDFPSKGNLSFGIGYKQEYVDSPGKWRKEYRPMLHMYYSKNFGNFKFNDRSRWEFRIIDGELTNRYRNQVQFSYTKYKTFTPYGSTEFSFYMDHFGYTRQRTLLGAKIPVKSLVLNLFLGHQINKDSPENWTHKFMLGTGLSYAF